MRFRLSSRRICLGAALLAGSGLLICSAQAAGKPRSRTIEFSSPKSEEVTTNLYQLTSKKDSLKQLEEDLYKPLESFAPKSSLDGVVARPPRTAPSTAIQNKRVKELLERRKNYMFMTPEELLGAPTLDDVLKTPELGTDSVDKKDSASFERYYKRMSNRKSTADRQIQIGDDDLAGAAKKTDPRDNLAVHEDSNLPSNVRETAAELHNKLFERSVRDSPFGQTSTRGNLVDMFGLATQPPTKEQLQEHKKFLDDYRAMVDPGWRPLAPADLLSKPNLASPPGLDVLANATSGQLGPGLPTKAASSQAAFDVQANVVNPQLGPQGLPDVNAQALGQPRALSALPKTEPTRIMPPPPTFAVPQRSFR